MRRRSSRLVLLVSGLATAAALATASCAHPATDRVLEPSGAAGSSSEPPSAPSTPLSDAGVSPVAPLATAVAPDEALPDFHLARAPEFGDRLEHRVPLDIFAATPAAGGMGGMGAAGGTPGLPPIAGGPGTGGGIFR